MYTPRTLSADTENRKIDPICWPKNPGIEPNMQWTWSPIAKIHWKFSNMTVGSSANRSADPENPTLGPQTQSELDNRFRTHSYLKFCQMCTGRHRVTSSVTWSLDSQCRAPYKWSIVTICLSCTVMEISSLEDIEGGHGDDLLGSRDVIGHVTIESADPDYLTLKPNRKWIGWLVAKIWPFDILPESEVGRRQYSLYWCHTLATLGTRH